MTNTPTEKLEEIYNEAQALFLANDHKPTPPKGLRDDIISHIDDIIGKIEQFQGVVNVLVTSLIEEILNPEQDIRIHQKKMEGGYSGRTLDTQYVAPFLKSQGLRSMEESGRLTRSLEQDHPYTLDYPGAIRDKNIKKGFLSILNYIEEEGGNPTKCLSYIFQLMIFERDNRKVIINKLESKATYQINDIIELIKQHFELSKSYGTARLPVIAIYSIYQSLISEVKRYGGMTLQPLGSHTSADVRSHDVGDIQINDKEGNAFEGVEVKYGKQITQQIVATCYEKIKKSTVQRYYILSTIPPLQEELPGIYELIDKSKEEHGCQIIVNGLIETLKYYLRLIENIDEFIENYSKNLSEDKVITKEHIKLRQEIINDYFSEKS